MIFQIGQHRVCCKNTSRFVGALGIVLLSALMMSGCSTAPIAPEIDAPETMSFKKHAAYNRPYKVRGKKYYPITNPKGYKARGIASWYGAESGNRTAMGTKFNPRGLSAAHKTLPLPSRVKVTNVRNNRSVILVVNDRGPFAKNRLIDLSQGAARAIGVKGLAEVEVEYLGGESQAMND